MPLGHIIFDNLMPKLRCEAECDPSFKQIIPYVLVEHKPTGRFFMTTRIGGEERLKGQASIGLGGHLEDGEDVVDALFRELEEEIGLEKEQMSETASSTRWTASIWAWYTMRTRIGRTLSAGNTTNWSEDGSRSMN